jgi:hypothetical protein
MEFSHLSNTVFRYIREALEVLPALAPPLRETVAVAVNKAAILVLLQAG